MNNELKELKEEMIEITKNNKQQKQAAATNEIKYKFYSTKKKIPWLIGGENIKPLPDINDSYFNFVELPQTKQFNFQTPFLADIVCDSEDYTYWKVERFTNGVKDKTYYFYTSRILTYLKNAFKLELSLDIYLTYTRNIINNLKSSNQLVKVNRTTIPGNLLKANNEDFKTIIKSLREIDSNVLNGNDSYVNAIGYPLEGTNPDNPTINLNKLPIQGKRLTYQNKVWGYFNNPSVYNANTNLGLWYTYRNDNGRYRSIFFNNEVKYTDQHYYLHRNQPFQEGPYEDQIVKNEFFGEMTFLESYRLEDMTAEQKKEINKNIANGYFMVFLNKEGYYDCYPILGKIPVKYRVPGVLVDNAAYEGSLSDHQSTNNIPLNNRVYSNKFTVINGDLNNDFQSMFNEYVINHKDFYPGVDSFKGIYRGVFPGSINHNIHFVIKENSASGVVKPEMQQSRFRFSDSDTRTFNFNHIIPYRMYYRIKQSDFMQLEIRNPRRASGLFELISPDKFNLIDNYIELLQPIALGTTEIIPIRYCFLANVKNNITGYTIPLSIAFMEGFKCFLKSTLYNNPTYNINLGGTLPINNAKYNRMLEQIEIQKNNGISSSIGNIISRPLNWLGGGFGSIGRTGNLAGFSDALTQEIAEGNVEAEWNPRYGTWEFEPDKRYSSKYRRLSGGLTVGGFGGFIGDFINISNTIKQSNFLKKNVGVGYITTTEEDLFGLVIHNDFISESKHQIPLQLEGQKLSTTTAIKLFTDTTKYKYKNYFQNFGFAINDFLKSTFINEVINHCKTQNENVFFSLDRDWSLMNLSELSDFTDNVVKNSIINQLASGIRLKNFN